MAFCIYTLFLPPDLSFICPGIHTISDKCKNLQLGYCSKKMKCLKSLCIIQFVALAVRRPYRAALIYAFKLKKLNSTAQWNNCNSRQSPGEVIIFNMTNKLHNWIQNMVQFFSSNKTLFSLHFCDVVWKKKSAREGNTRMCL